MPTRLTPEVVADALGALEGWTGNEDRISRTVPLEADQAAKLKVFVAESADSMNQGGVTELDIALAARIDDLVSQVCGVPPSVDQPDEFRAAILEAERKRHVDVLADERRASDFHGHKARGEPLMGVEAASAGMPATPMPDTAPFEPEPGVESPEGRQGGGPS
jgi:pterin-4a-carbinolamine dehydratase